MYEWKLFREYPEATSRFLLALAEALRLSRLDTLPAEPGLTNVRSEVQRFVDQLGDGDPIFEALEPWLGRVASLGKLAAEYGCLSEWLSVTAASITPHMRFGPYVTRCMTEFLSLGVPLNSSLPALAELLDPEQSATTVRQQLESGAGMSTVVEDWPTYSEPLASWLEVCEKNGEILKFHTLLSNYVVDHGLEWPLDVACGRPGALASTLLVVGLGLDLGRSLDQVMEDLPAGPTAETWRNEIQTAYARTGSLAGALERAGVISPLGCAIIEQAEAGGQLPNALVACVTLIRHGILIELPPLPEPHEDSSARGDDGLAGSDSFDPWIEGISIRARLAYGLLCVEAALADWNASSQRVSSILRSLWEFASTRRADQWETRVESGQLLQHVYLSGDESDGPDWLEIAKLWDLQDLDEIRAEALVKMLCRVFAIGTNNLYSGYESHLTADPLREILEIMRAIGVSLPDRSRVSLSRADERDGWGDPRPPTFFR